MELKRKTVDGVLCLMDGKNIVLAMEEKQEEQTLTIILKGNLRSETLHSFQDELSALASFGLDIVLECKEVSYISAACVDALIRIQQKMDDVGKGSLTILDLPEEILSEWKMKGINQVLMVEEG